MKTLAQRTKRNDTRVALWTERQELLCDAQALEFDAADLRMRADQLVHKAIAKRVRAIHISAAAEELGKLEAGL